MYQVLDEIDRNEALHAMCKFDLISFICLYCDSNRTNTIIHGLSSSQHDGNEFILWLVNSLHNELRVDTRGWVGEKEHDPGVSVIREYFKFTVRVSKKCDDPSCGREW